MLVFTALSDPTRFHIVEILAAHGQLAAGDIYKRFSVSSPAVSQHLKVLKEANLVRVEVRAQQRLYSLNLAGIAEAEQWIAKMKAMWEEQFDALDLVLKKEVKKSTNPKTRGKHGK